MSRDKMRLASRVAAYVLAAFFMLTSVSKLVTWSDFWSAFRSLEFLRLLFGDQVLPVAVGVIVVEAVLAVALILPRTRKWAAGGSFLLLNLFLFFLVMEERVGGSSAVCPCFGGIPMAPPVHVLVNIIGSVIGLFLFSYEAAVSSRWRVFGATALIYVAVAVLGSRPVWQAAQQPPADGVNRAWVYDLLQAAGSVNMPEEQLRVLCVINMADLDCSYCASSVEEFLSKTSEDAVLLEHTHVVVTDPQALGMSVEAMDWVSVRAPEVHATYLPLPVLAASGLDKSSLIVFDASGQIAGHGVFPLDVAEMLETFRSTLGG